MQLSCMLNSLISYLSKFTQTGFFRAHMKCHSIFIVVLSVLFNLDLSVRITKKWFTILRAPLSHGCTREVGRARKSVKIIDVLEIQIFLWWSLYFQSQLL